MATSLKCFSSESQISCFVFQFDLQTAPKAEKLTIPDHKCYGENSQRQNQSGGKKHFTVKLVNKTLQQSCWIDPKLTPEQIFSDMWNFSLHPSSEVPSNWTLSPVIVYVYCWNAPLESYLTPTLRFKYTPTCTFNLFIKQSRYFLTVVRWWFNWESFMLLQVTEVLQL